jgi:hypothetical protein
MYHKQQIILNLISRQTQTAKEKADSSNSLQLEQKTPPAAIVQRPGGTVRTDRVEKPTTSEGATVGKTTRPVAQATPGLVTVGKTTHHMAKALPETLAQPSTAGMAQAAAAQLAQAALTTAPASRTAAAFSRTTAAGTTFGLFLASQKCVTPPECATVVGPPEVVYKPHYLAQLWAERAPATKERVSPKWDSDKQRYLFLACFSQQDREALVQELMDQVPWTYKSAEKYVSAFIAALKDLDLPVTNAHRAHLQYLHFQALEEDSKHPTVPAEPDEIERAIQALLGGGHTEESVALELAYVIGQRQGDVLNLRTASLSIVQKYVAIQFRVGKCTRRVQPFCLHVPTESRVGRRLLELQTARVTSREDFLFRSHQDKLQVLTTIKAALKNVNVNLTILSVRRGGLQAMALAQLPMWVLLHHSRHTTEKNLMRYLNWGEVFTAGAAIRFAMQPDQMEACKMARQTPTSASLGASRVETAPSGTHLLEEELRDLDRDVQLPAA